MGVFKDILSTLSGMWKDIKEIKACNNPQNVAKAKRLDEIEAVLGKISIPLDKAFARTDDQGNVVVRVKYQPIVADIVIDQATGEAWYPPIIVAMNTLDFVPYRDMVEVEHKVESATKSVNEQK